MSESNAHIEPKSVELSFNCQEDPESMTNTANGAFCHTCRKEVIDFTSKSFSEIEKIRGNQSEMCGKFRVEQIEPELRPINVPKVRSLAFLSTILLSLNFSSASAQSSVDPKIEQAQGSNTPDLTSEKLESTEQLSANETARTHTKDSKEEDSKIRFVSIDQKKWYRSMRFPFVHRRRRHRYGAMGVRTKF